MTQATQDCTGCPVSAGTHKPADAVHTEIAEPGAPAVPEPWGACVGGRIWIGKLPDHVHKLAAQEEVAIQWLYTEQQVHAMQAAPAAPVLQPLTDEQIDALWGGENVSVPQLVNRRAISRSIERAHGIGVAP